jgi:hypothetical protein
MRFHLKDFDGYRVSVRPDAYYIGYVEAARSELLCAGLSFDPDTGIVYEGRTWIERPGTGSAWTDADRAAYGMPDATWEDFLARHVRARAARLANIARGIGAPRQAGAAN